MTDANTPRDRADEGDARDRAPREPARDPLDDTRADGVADAPVADFGPADPGPGHDGPAEPALAPEDRVEDSGVDDRGASLDGRGDAPATSAPDSSTGSYAPPAVSFGDAPAASTTDGSGSGAGSLDREPVTAVPFTPERDDEQGRPADRDAGAGLGHDADRDARVDESGDADRRSADGGVAGYAATTTPESSTTGEHLPADDRPSSDHADTEVLPDRVETDERHDVDSRDSDRVVAAAAADSDRADSDADRGTAPVVPPVVAPTPPASRAWSAAPQDDSGRPLHDDDALRAAEAHRAADTDADTRADADGRSDDSPTVVAPAAPARGDDAPTTAWRTDDGRVAGRSGAAAAGAAGGTATGSQAYPLVAEGADPVALRRELLTEQKQEFSGLRPGAGLLGWFAATGFGVSVFLVFAAIASAVVAASSGSSAGGFRGYLEENGEVLSIVTGVVVLVIVFAGYFVGGFTASRVARFSGFKQGLATWLWGLIITVVVGVVAAVVGVQAGDQSSPNPMVPSMDDLSSTSVESIVFLGLLVVLSFAGAVLGGLLGQRYHRKVDRFVPDHQV